MYYRYLPYFTKYYDYHDYIAEVIRDYKIASFTIKLKIISKELENEEYLLNE